MKIKRKIIKLPRNFYAIKAHFRSGAGLHKDKEFNTCCNCGKNIELNEIWCSKECSDEYKFIEEDDHL